MSAPPAAPRAELDYVGVRQPCGCITAWASAKHSTRREIQAFYSDMARTGREVRRAPLEDVWDKLGSCPHFKVPQ